MQLSIAERHDFIQIAKQVYDLWSAGLTKDAHRRLLCNTYYQPWSRRNNYRLVYKSGQTVVSSCKVVHLPLVMKGQDYKVMGLGAIFTMPTLRGQGLASKLIQAVIKRAEMENFDAILLFSDIDRDFYHSFGFEDLGELDFEITVDNYLVNKVSSNNFSQDIEALEILFSSFHSRLKEKDLAELIRCHNRWLARQPYGISRTEDYFAFQLAKYVYMANYSKNNRPLPCITVLRTNSTIEGYSITECSGTTIRLLEIVGDHSARAKLWQNLMGQAKQTGMKRICGFESMTRDFIPTVSLDYDLFNIEPAIKPRHLQCYERTWGQPMFLALNIDLENLNRHNPCPLLEFDYF